MRFGLFLAAQQVAMIRGPDRYSKARFIVPPAAQGEPFLVPEEQQVQGVQRNAVGSHLNIHCGWDHDLQSCHTQAGRLLESKRVM